MIQRGELRLPEMQRRYVWRSTRVRDLMDSLYRGYPSGAILVWDTDEGVPLQEFAVTQANLKMRKGEAKLMRRAAFEKAVRSAKTTSRYPANVDPLLVAMRIEFGRMIRPLLVFKPVLWQFLGQFWRARFC